jgi:hypothetical protein
MEGVKNAFKILAGKRKGKIPLGNGRLTRTILK